MALCAAHKLQCVRYWSAGLGATEALPASHTYLTVTHAPTAHAPPHRRRTAHASSAATPLPRSFVKWALLNDIIGNVSAAFFVRAPPPRAGSRPHTAPPPRILSSPACARAAGRRRGGVQEPVPLFRVEQI